MKASPKPETDTLRVNISLLGTEYHVIFLLVMDQDRQFGRKPLHERLFWDFSSMLMLSYEQLSHTGLVCSGRRR